MRTHNPGDATLVDPDVPLRSLLFQRKDNETGRFVNERMGRTSRCRAGRVPVSGYGQPAPHDGLRLRTMSTRLWFRVGVVAQRPQAQCVKERELREPETRSLKHLHGFFGQPLTRPGLDALVKKLAVRCVLEALCQRNLK